MAGREWRHQPRLLEAFLRKRSDGPMLFGISMDERDAAEEREESWRVWYAPPDRRRVEFAVGHELVTAVFRGNTWWSWSPSQGGRSNGGRPSFDHGRGPGEVLIEPATVLAALELEVLGEGTLIGREVYRLRARPIDADWAGPPTSREAFHRSFALHDLGSGADDYELLVDKERGFLLRAEARLGGQPFRVVEATALEMDGEITDDVFTLALPEGEAFDDSETVRAVSLDELPSAVSFPVFVLDRAAAPAAPTATIRRADPRQRAPLVVSLSYRILEDGRFTHLSIQESGEPPPAPPGPEQVAEALHMMGAENESMLVENWRSEGEFSVCEQSFMGQRRVRVRLVRAGTYLELESDTIEIDQLVGRARTLVPLSP